MDFQFAKPKEVGIQEEWLISFLNRLEMQGLPMHSAIIARQGKICMDTYYQPYNKDSLHRMFSVTKSMAAMAIGLLIEEGKLSLSDKIIDFFPDKLPEEGVYPYMAMLTIKDIQNNLGIGKNNAYRLIKSPGFPTIKIGRKYLVPEDEFETWVQNSLHKKLLQ